VLVVDRCTLRSVRWAEVSRGGTYSEMVDTCLFGFALVLTFMTAIPKVPAAYVGLHPGGALPEGEIFAVTPCGKGDASMAAARARRAREYLIFAVEQVQRDEIGAERTSREQRGWRAGE
jgi:hypothetical protein